MRDDDPSATPEDRSDPRDSFFDVTGLDKDIGARTGRSALAVVAASAVRMLISLGGVMVLVRLVAPADHGVFAMALPAVLIAAGLSEFGLSHVVVQRPVVTHRLVSAFFFLNLALGSVLAVVVASLAPVLAGFYDDPRVAPVILALAPYVLFLVLSTHYVSILRRQLRVAQVERAAILSQATAMVGAITAALLGAGIWALVLQLLIAPIMHFLLLYRVLRWVPSVPSVADFKAARDGIAFGGFLAAERLVGEFIKHSQILVIGRFFSPAITGQFFRSLGFASIPYRQIGSPLAGAFIPSLSRLQDSPDQFNAMFLRQVDRANLFILPMGAALTLAPEAVVTILMGPGWEEAIPMMRILGISTMASLTIASANWPLVACGQGRALFLFRLASLVVIMAALFAAAPFGVMAVIIAFVVATVPVLGVAAFVLACRVTPLRPGLVVRLMLRQAAFILPPIAAGYGLRWLGITNRPLEHAVAAALLLGLALAIRILVTPDLKSDVGKALTMATAALNRRKGPSGK